MSRRTQSANAETKETPKMNASATPTNRTPTARIGLAIGAFLATFALIPASALAVSPQWTFEAKQVGIFAPGATGNSTEGPDYELVAKNEGAAATSGAYTIKDTLPAQLSPTAEVSAEDQGGHSLSCSTVGQKVSCTTSEPLGTGESATMIVPVEVADVPPGTNAEDEASVEGGGAEEVTANLFTQIGVPAWRISVSSQPTDFPPNYSLSEGNLPEYAIQVVNVGSAPSNGPLTVTDELPPGITEHGSGLQTVSLTAEDFRGPSPSGAVVPGQPVAVEIPVDVGSLLEGTTLTNAVRVEGGGAVSPAASTTTTTISSSVAPFDFLPGAGGLSGLLNGAEGQPVTQASAHPFQLTLRYGFPTKQIGTTGFKGELFPVGGGLRDLRTTLPRGVTVNPAATPVRCAEAQFEREGCPDASQVGVAYVESTAPAYAEKVTQLPSPFYNMVPTRGEAAQFGFEPQEAGVFVHVSGGVRSGRYALGADANDVLSLFSAPVLGAEVHLWGDPSAPAHDLIRGRCGEKLVGSSVYGKSCAVAPQHTPFLSMPSRCGALDSLEASADDWYEPGAFHDRATQMTDLAGNPSEVSGCDKLGEGFQPTLEARSTTTQGDSPSGLSVDLHIPQSNDLSELATANLRKAVVALPEGITLNPSSANGLQGCSSAQVGIDTSTGVPNGNPPTCPDASRVADLEVVTPLLDHALPGSVYVATPYDNPFHSLLAIYAVVDDPVSGTLVKLPGHVEADPNTGRLTTTFDENPQLPFSDFKIKFFGGAGAVLRTPAVCGAYSTTSSLTPWSAPESGPPATPHDDYSITGNCSQSEASARNSPEFGAGTVAPIAGKYTPFLIHLRREDSAQQFSTISVTPPPGLLAKLAGVPYCPEAALATAAAKSGREEQANPSCPVASQIGTVHVAAGAGPAPFWTTGNAYLTGPYKGAPLSMAIVVPAAAGPYDLGTVVNRVALRVDPETALITAVSDPIPHILQGIPLDVRQIEVAIDRNEFTRTGTSCDPMAVKGDLVSLLGQSAALSVPYQLGNCANLRFRPSLSLRLTGQSTRGGHPGLRATLKMPEASAAIAKASVALPHSEFLDQAHIGTVCTRVQYAAGPGGGAECPAASVYGHATAWSPLLEAPLSGPVFLRSSSHELPDLLASLDGQIHVDLDGRVDSINGGIRSTFEAVPDAPVSKFVLTMRGAKKGLLQNSTNICKGTHRATVAFDAQNGAAADLSPALVNSKCAKGRSHRRRRGR